MCFATQVYQIESTFANKIKTKPMSNINWVESVKSVMVGESLRWKKLEEQVEWGSEGVIENENGDMNL